MLRSRVEPLCDGLNRETDRNSVVSQETLRERGLDSGSTPASAVFEYIRTVVAGIAPADVLGEQGRVGIQVARLQRVFVRRHIREHRAVLFGRHLNSLMSTRSAVARSSSTTTLS